MCICMCMCMCMYVNIYIYINILAFHTSSFGRLSDEYLVDISVLSRTVLHAL